MLKLLSRRRRLKFSSYMLDLSLSSTGQSTRDPPATASHHRIFLFPSILRFTMHVVGIFNVQSGDPYWHGYNFLPYTPDTGCCTQYTVLASQQNFLTALDRLASSHSVSQVYFFDPFYLFWYYQLAPSHISVTQLNDLINQLGDHPSKYR